MPSPKPAPFPADQLLIRSGEELNTSLILLDGWLARSKDLPSGERQVTELHVAGDFADLHGFTLKRLDHDVMTLSRCIVAVVPHERLQAIHRALSRGWRGSIGYSTNVDARDHARAGAVARAAIGDVAHGASVLRAVTRGWTRSAGRGPTATNSR